MSKLINILVRTHRRPKSFKRLLESIYSQTYKNYRLIVSVDDDLTYQYVKESGIEDKDIVRVSSEDKHIYAFYNEYFNSLIERVDNGYIYCIDDDDYFMNEESLAIVARESRIDSVCIYRMHYNGRLLPCKENFGKRIVLADIGTPCFSVHVKHTWMAKWLARDDADGIYIKELSEAVGSVKWVDVAICMVENSNTGRGEV